jgi:Cof subfamily protein (haloacid dehalogenase superfamily)
VTTFPPSAAALPTGVTPGGRFGEWRPAVPGYVVVDVDGTLLGLTGEATPVVVEAVEACRAAGLPVGLATGRMPAACAALAEQAGLSGPHVVHNGAEVRADGVPVHTWPLSADRVATLLEVCRRHDLYAELYVGDGYLVTDQRMVAAPHWALLGSLPDGVVGDEPPPEVLKATVLAFPGDDVEGVLADLRAAGLTPGPAQAPAVPDVTFVNVTAEGADKGRAVAAAAAHLGCTLAEVVAVGDGLNDLSMLAVAGTAIAMGQSGAVVREAAHIVVPELDDDGVAHALRAAVGWRTPA